MVVSPKKDIEDALQVVFEVGDERNPIDVYLGVYIHFLFFIVGSVEKCDRTFHVTFVDGLTHQGKVCQIVQRHNVPV